MALLLVCTHTYVLQVASGRLAYSHVDDESEMASAPKRRKIASSRIERPRGVAEQFRQADVSDVQEVSRIFEGKEFCIVNGTMELSKQDIERKIAEVKLNVFHE